MPGTPTTKYAIPTLSGADLARDIDTNVNAGLTAIDSKMVGYSEGPLSSRPVSTPGTPGIAGREYRATDVGVTYKDYGTGWVELGLGGMSKIAELAPTAGVITFSSIPQGYRHLRVQGVVRVDATPGAGMSLIANMNGDTGGNYDSQQVSGVGAAVAANHTLAGTRAFIGTILDETDASVNTNGMAAVTMDLLDYRGGRWKTWLAQVFTPLNLTTGHSLRTSGGQWRSTAAITSLAFTGAAAAPQALDAGSLLTLYGVA